MVPSKFVTIIVDFVRDLNLTFPEYKHVWSKYETTEESSLLEVYQHCNTVYPERFFDILYQNEEIFLNTSVLNTEFLPGFDFKLLFHCNGVTEKTKNSIWKYLQLILFSIVGNIKDKTEFKNSANLFEGIDENELQSKLTEAMSNISEFFTSMEPEKEAEETSHPEKNDLPNPDDLHNHLKGLFDGKLGSLAKELLDELTEDIKETLGLDPNEFDEHSSPKDVFAKLMKNPQKFMEIVQKINSKFQDKIKKGDLSQEDMMKEAGDLMRKMKEMSGNSKQMNEMFQNLAKTMGQGMNKKNTRVDTNAIDRMVKMQSTRERLLAKIEKKKAVEATPSFFLKEGPNGQKVYQSGVHEEQTKSSVVRQDMTDTELSVLAAEIEGVGVQEKKKKRKGKK